MGGLCWWWTDRIGRGDVNRGDRCEKEASLLPKWYKDKVPLLLALRSTSLIRHILWRLHSLNVTYRQSCLPVPTLLCFLCWLHPLPHLKHFFCITAGEVTPVPALSVISYKSTPAAFPGETRIHVQCFQPSVLHLVLLVWPPLHWQDQLLISCLFC